MADVEHTSITDPYIHEPKGAANANVGEYYVTDGIGGGAWTPIPSTPGFEYNVSTIIEGRSAAAAQIPVNPGIGTQVEFGPQIVTPDVELSALGAITFNTPGSYYLSIGLQIGREAGSATSRLHFRTLKNGSQVGNTTSAIITSVDQIYRTDFGIWVDASASDVFTVEMTQDLTGHASGGLINGNVTAAGWATSPSAVVYIQRFL